MPKITLILCLLSLALLTGPLAAQEVLSEIHIKNFSTDPLPWPYEPVEPNRDLVYRSIQPSLPISESEFIYLWKPNERFSRDRRLRKYNLLLEEQWTTDFRIHKREEILAMIHEGDSLLMLSFEDATGKELSKALLRVFDLDSGKVAAPRILLTAPKGVRNIHLSFSPDSSHFAFYYYHNLKLSQRAQTYYEYDPHDLSIRYRVSNASRASYIVFDRQLNAQRSGTLLLPAEKLTVLDFAIDNGERVYLTAVNKQQELLISQQNPGSDSAQTLRHPGYVKPHKLADPYATLLPPTIGAQQKVFVLQSERSRKNGKMQTTAFQVICFDFEKSEIDLSRRIEINPSLLVQLQKSREAFGLKPETEFDEYLLRDMMEMEDSSLWLMVQKYKYSESSDLTGMDNFSHSSQNLYEIVFFEFSPGGKVRKALIVPFYQKIRGALEQTSQFYSIQLDRRQKRLRMISREVSGSKLKGSQRIFYRTVDLETNIVSPRIPLVDSKRSDQYLQLPYVVWQNPAHVILMVMEGSFGKPLLRSIRLR